MFACSPARESTTALGAPDEPEVNRMSCARASSSTRLESRGTTRQRIVLRIALDDRHRPRATRLRRNRRAARAHVERHQHRVERERRQRRDYKTPPGLRPYAERAVLHGSLACATTCIDHARTASASEP